MLLAIDTSTELSGLACYDQHGLLAECAWQSGRNHTSQVMQQIEMTMHHIRRTAADVQVVAVALGPGSWSGLRVGLSIAKGMALAGGLALIGIGTLDALAYQHRWRALPVYPLIRLGRARFATARFLTTDVWHRAGGYRNVTLEGLCAEIDEPVLFCGDIDQETQEQIRYNLGGHAHFAAPAANLRRPGYLAELAWQRFAAGHHDQIAQLEPLYLGEPVQPKKEKSRA